MKAAILIVSHTHDAHALEVLQRLEQRGFKAILFDTGRIPRETRLTITHDMAAGWGGAASVNGQPLELTEVRSVWWRRPQPYNVHVDVGGTEDRCFVLAETHAAVSGLWALLDARWMNDPEHDDKAGRKAWQLKVARDAGFIIPHTCITNEPDRARAFVASVQGPVVYKTFSATERTWRETRVLQTEEETLLDTVRYAPVIFQEYVAARTDLRVTVVGEEIFAAEIHSQTTTYPHDFRIAMHDAKIVSHALPLQIEAQVRRLMATLGLVYGAIDLRHTPAGEYVFLEINPAGQWLFIEHRTGQPISNAVANTLISLAQRLQ